MQNSAGNARRDAYSALVRKLTGAGAIGVIGATGGLTAFIAGQAPVAAAATTTTTTPTATALAPVARKVHHHAVRPHVLKQASAPGAATPAHNGVTQAQQAEPAAYVPASTPASAPAQHSSGSSHSTPSSSAPAPKPAPQPAPAPAPQPAPAPAPQPAPAPATQQPAPAPAPAPQPAPSTSTHGS